jgi:excisionase family DNA binding protein
MTAEKSQKMLSVDQVADVLNVSTKTVRRVIDDGALHHHRVGRVIRVSGEDLRAYLSATRQ